ncbi:MAG: peptidylprolyl isomerase [Alphaproteobacteria bacterium]|nr:peptidylprolyl isomerase [Alphaproteobacteria bacterium]
MTTPFRIPTWARPALLALGLAVAFMPAAGIAQPAIKPTASPDAARIVAIVNGEVIAQGDVDNRRRLFALSAGMGAAPEVLSRLTGQVTNQLVDERLKLREMQRRQVVVPDVAIAEAIRNLENRNGMPEGAMRKRLGADGVAMRTLIDQIRVQIGWGQVLRLAMGTQLTVSEADLVQRENSIKALVGQMEFRIGEILVAYPSPEKTEDARRFAETIIQQLRAGAPFPVVAAQFSQSQSALQGGDAGWVQGIELDPAVLRVAGEMPEGAVSNPIPVPGGLSIVTLRGKRQIGRDQATMMTLRQVFYKFATPLLQENPTDAQRQLIERARQIGTNAKSCSDMEAAAKAAGDEKGGDPGEVRLEGVQVPALRQLMGSQPVGKGTQPLIADDGVAVMMICSREVKTLELPNRRELADRILGERAELAARQMIRDLQRRAVIEYRN